MSLEEIILKDHYNRLVLNTIPDSYLVGGFIRNILLSRESKDRDYSVKMEPEDAAGLINTHTDGTVVRLKDPLVIRIALEDGTTLDFTRYEHNIKEDLLRRDFTFNAIAFSLDKGIYDPLGGFNDLQKGRVRVIREDNLVKDPVRVIRAYRFIGELNGFIDDNTRKALRCKKYLLQYSPSERITSEFFKLLESRAFQKALYSAFKDNVINEIIPLKNNKLEHYFDKIVEVDKRLENLPEGFLVYFKEFISQEITLKGLIILNVLLKGVEVGSTRLTLSNKIQRRILQFKRGENEDSCKDLTDKSIYDCFTKLGDSLMEFIVLNDNIGLFTKAEKFLRVKRTPLLDGEEIKRAIKIKEGPLVGRLLHEVSRAQFEGTVADKEDAVRYLFNNLRHLI